jgi:hypothetical protein
MAGAWAPVDHASIITAWVALGPGGSANVGAQPQES